MKIIVITFWLAISLFALDRGVKADESPTAAKVDSPAAPQTGTAPAASPQADPAPTRVETAAPASTPQIDPAMMAALAQASKIMTQSSGTAASPAIPEAAGKIPTTPDPGTAAESDPAVTAAMAQAAKILAQSLGDPATLAAMQKQASALSETGHRDGKELVRDNEPKVERDDSRQEAQAELEQAQQMADAALANASQAVASTATTSGSQDNPLPAGNRGRGGHRSMNGLVDSAQLLGPDPSDKNHHTMDSLF